MMNQFLEGLECTGCSITPESLIKDEGFTEEEIEEYSVFMDCGFWYCHRYCLRDSQ
jgi:hypothetical protein